MELVPPVYKQKYEIFKMAEPIFLQSSVPNISSTILVAGYKFWKYGQNILKIFKFWKYAQKF
jgi:hypothetical protein